MATGDTLRDGAEGAGLTRAVLARSFGSATAHDSVTIVARSNPYSSDGAALCFSADDTAANRFGSLARAAGAVVNTAAPERPAASGKSPHG